MTRQQRLRNKLDEQIKSSPSPGAQSNELFRAFEQMATIQSDNKKSLAIHLKLNQLTLEINKANNLPIVVEALTHKEPENLNEFYIRFSEVDEQEADLHTPHPFGKTGELHISGNCLQPF